MANLDDNIENGFDGDDDITAPGSKLSRKKLLLIVVPVVAAIGIFGFYYTSQKSQKDQAPTNYSIVRHAAENGKETDSYTIFYDLPEVDVRLRNVPGKDQVVKIKLSIELSKMEDITIIEALSAKLTDAVIAHTIELMPEEIDGSEGIYWLREELLYRMNLIAAPVKISNLNFKNFEIVRG